MEMYGTERTNYMDEILDDKFQRRIDALRSDNLDEIIALTEVMPVNSYLLKSAVQEKATEVTSWVIAQGISADFIDLKTGKSLLYIACDGKPYDFTFDNRIELVKTLLDAGADVNLKDNKGDTPIGRMFINQGGKHGDPISLVKVLLEAGADVNDVTSQNQSLLLHATLRKNDALVRLFLDEGATIDEGTLTSMNISPAAMKMFMDNGADPVNFVDNIQGITDPEAQHDFVVLLMEKGAAASDFDLRFVRDNFKTLTYLVESGADVATSDVLMNCISDYKGIERIKYLVEHGADLTRKYYKDYTALHFAVKSKKSDVTAYLIAQGAELNPVDSKGKTPLDYCKSRDEALMTLLIEAGAKSASEL
jgi:ankyrin repeat protein